MPNRLGRRGDAEEVVKHAYFDKLDWEVIVPLLRVLEHHAYFHADIDMTRHDVGNKIVN